MDVVVEHLSLCIRDKYINARMVSDHFNVSACGKARNFPCYSHILCNLHNVDMEITWHISDWHVSWRPGEQTTCDCLSQINIC